MPRTLLKRSAALTALCTAESLPAECPVHAVDDKVWRGVPQAPALYPVGDSEVYSVAVSPCGRLCCAGTTTGDVFVHNTMTGEQMMHNKPGYNETPSVAFSLDGARLAVSTAAGATVFCTVTWTALKQFPRQGIQSVRWTHCGDLVALASQLMLLWNVVTGVCHTSSAVAGYGGLAVSRLNAFAVHSCGTCISVFDVNSLGINQSLTHTRNYGNPPPRATPMTHGYRRQAAPPRGPIVCALALTDDEQQLVSGLQDATLQVWCTTSHTLLRTITPPPHASAYEGQPSFFSIAVSRKSDVLAVVSQPDSRHQHCGSPFDLLKFSTGVSAGTTVIQSALSHIALSPCGTRVFTRGKHGVQVSATNTA
eukprot:TRINITY_DN3537_c0_g1_i4.p1 TRINITY_DN3537_c0_g1~~TRINITY_DN3537_c0_g1_i4.p1  ORF type:complete len:380 (+),score=33.28 TRINITY_DN3537_c0_g1_i4:47-1141(+)